MAETIKYHVAISNELLAASRVLRQNDMNCLDGVIVLGQLSGTGKALLSQKTITSIIKILNKQLREVHDRIVFENYNYKCERYRQQLSALQYLVSLFQAVIRNQNYTQNV